MITHSLQETCTLALFSCFGWDALSFHMTPLYRKRFMTAFMNDTQWTLVVLFLHLPFHYGSEGLRVSKYIPLPLGFSPTAFIWKIELFFQYDMMPAFKWLSILTHSPFSPLSITQNIIWQTKCAHVDFSF